MPEILVNQKESSAVGVVSPDALSRHGARVFAAASLVLVLGVVLDLFTLWVLQRQETPQWEFVALTTTTNAFPLLLISLVFLYGALALSRSSSVRAYRVAAIVGLLFGLIALGVGFLVGTNYLALNREASGAAGPAVILFKSQALKAGVVSAMFGGLMLVVGLLGLRAPRRT
jgi:hypothetical protein